ncbi:hypothetical protein TPR58_03690 [Sphingomonas sp. HF-S3]|uniref:PIN domain-containing protein n=1 Tax=Sphingomonas rustica TaxID=3103142 RepID=A0ABV0B4Y9_9SPHN
MRTAILDTNLLCLLVAGAEGGGRVPNHKRLQAYDDEAYSLLIDLISRFDRIVVCPQILAESSSLLRLAPEPLKSRLTARLGAMLDQIVELHIPVIQCVNYPEFDRLGVTDSVILAMLATDGVLLSADLDLYLAAGKRSSKVINFSHLRDGSIKLGVDI